MKRILPFALLLTILGTSGCLRYLTHERDEVVLEGIDVDQTLRVAEMTLGQGDKWGSVLTVWALRDQELTAEQARRISVLYFSHVDSLRRSFNIWHLTWAISNMYRLASSEVKMELDSAYRDATQRAARVHRSADKHANGEKIYMGDAHVLGRAYAKRHLVIPGNKQGYLQSFDEFVEKRRR